MSRNVLKEDAPHTYFDDLESFYYVFCWIIASFESAGVPKAEVPKQLTWWDREQLFSSTMKGGHMGLNFALPVSPWFGKAIPTLASRLHAFFRFRRKPTHDPVGDYDDFLSRIRKGIADLESEGPDATNEAVLPALGAKDAVPSKRKRSSSIDDESHPDSRRPRARPRPAWLRIKTRPSIARQRRANADYGDSGKYDCRHH